MVVPTRAKMPKYTGGHPKKPKPVDPRDELHPTSIRLSERHTDFLREEAVKRGYFSYKFPGMGAVSTMITDLVEQFYNYTHPQPKKRKKITVK